jgi:PmbA protein
MMQDLGCGILVTQFMGQGANLVTGDYSRGISGFWFENGELLYPVAEITIAGHLNDIFAALEPADDLEFRQAVNAPSVFIGELTVGGR